eukprot:CAMPEP_0172813458 /NCGR_PEP_ID=MMETSP1075-20121228/10673_1 /TAXON_ID=2916 /ORGANISM="Ceratium fusus, Strain PA161109" /LENGTH=213 /DNA_ID=CAMNT_0013653161 /DNA_START=53 /DNA_END=694 /DNA_ORIENTATION=+
MAAALVHAKLQQPDLDACLQELVEARAVVLAALQNAQIGDDKEDCNPVSVITNSTTGCDKELQQTVSTKLNPQFVWNPAMSQLCWKDIDNCREQRRDLLLRGVPRCMCTREGLKHVLQACGLLASVARIEALCHPTKRCGHAILAAKSSHDVAKLGRFFHGWQCGNHMPIAVSFCSGALEWRLKAGGGGQGRTGSGNSPCRNKADKEDFETTA